MFRIVIAPDKFKGSLDSFAVCANIEKGLRSAVADISAIADISGISDIPAIADVSAIANVDILQLPLADGGDGLLDIIAYYTGAGIHRAQVKGPLFKPIMADWLLSADGRTAFIEMAKASGLQLLGPSEYDCMQSSTYGTGELIAEAIRAGAEEIVIGIGGSATNDGGIGMAAALGYRFLDADGMELLPTGANLARLAKIVAPRALAGRGESLRFRVACDVTNPLCGPTGATRIYGPQKGADPAMIEELETGMLHYAELLKRDLGLDIAEKEGAGAAGGLGAGCMAFLQAELVRGADLAIEYSNAEQHIRTADLVITGEGKIDGQTLEGKLVAGVAALGRQYHKPVVAICGALDLSPGEWRLMGITAAFSIVNKPMSLQEAQAQAAMLVADTAYGVGALIFAHNTLMP